jgi:hypothetical protein
MVNAEGEGAEAVSLARMSGGTEIGMQHLTRRNCFFTRTVTHEMDIFFGD